MADLQTIDTKKGFGSHILVETTSSSLPLSPPPSSSSSVSPCSSLSETVTPSLAVVGSGVDGHHQHPSVLDVTRPLDRAPRLSDQQRSHAAVGPVPSSERMTTSSLLSRRNTATASGRPRSMLLSRTRSRSTLVPLSNDHDQSHNASNCALPHHPSFTSDIGIPASLTSSNNDMGEDREGGGHPFWDGPDTSSNTDVFASRKRPLDRTALSRANPRGPRPIPTLRRRSTNSMIAGIRLGGNSDDEDEIEDDHPLHLHEDDRQRNDGNSLIKRQNSRTTLLRRDSDRERQALQCITPDTDTAVEISADRPLRRTVTKTSSSINLAQCPEKPRRRPLGDISFSALTDKGSAVPVENALSPPRDLKRPRLTDVERIFTSPYFGEYGEEVFQHMLEIESRHSRYFYSSQHPTIQGSTRCVLVDWVMHLGYYILRMQPETVHHGVNLLDRFLIEHDKEIHVDRLQCISVAALLVAGKLVETATRLSTHALSYACSHAFSAQNITDQELDLLKTLKFELTVASVSTFAQYFKQALEIDEDLDDLVDYLCDVSLLSHHFLEFSLSRIAAAAISLALQVKGRPWTKDMEMRTGYPSQKLMPCIVVFMETLQNIQKCIPCTFGGLRQKYPQAELHFL